MRHRVLLIASLVVVLVSMATAAYAKGPLGATVTGDGVAGTLTIDQSGEPGQGTAMSRFVDAVGFMDLVFGNSTGIIDEQPTPSHGTSELTIRWDMGDGAGIVQALYLDAAGGPVTHVAPGQVFWDGQGVTMGGWYTITRDIASPLIDLGVDESVVAHLVQATDLTTKTEPAKQAATQVETTQVETPPVAGASPVERASTSPTAAGGIVLPLIVAALVAAVIIGAGSWMRRRRPISR